MQSATTSRRAFLAGIGTAAALTGGIGANALAIIATRPAAAAEPAAALATPPVSSSEDPSLVALGEEFDGLVAAYDSAEVRVAETRAEAERLCPPVPSEIVYNWRSMPSPYNACTKEVRGLCGEELPQQVVTREDGSVRNAGWRHILVADKLREFGLPDVGGPRSRSGREMRRRLAIAEQYEAARCAAIERSGLEAALEEHDRADRELLSCAWKIGRTTPFTFAGVAIHARMMVAVDRVRCPSGEASPAGLWFGKPLADAVLQIAGQGRA